MTTADKLLSVLTLFSLEQPEWTVEDAAQELGLPVSTAYRYFRSLSRAGLIVAFASGRYVLGPAILQLDRQIRLLDPLISTAAPIMKRLARVGPSHGIVLLCRLYRDQVMCVHLESVERPDFAISYERGRPMPIFRGAASKAILANLPSRTARELQRRFATEMQQSGLGQNWDAVKARLRELREAGTAVTRSELDVGMAGIAAPVFGPNEGVIGSLSFVVPARVITKRFLVFRGSQLRAASHDIHEGLRLLAVGHAGMKSPKSDSRRIRH